MIEYPVLQCSTVVSSVEIVEFKLYACILTSLFGKHF